MGLVHFREIRAGSKCDFSEFAETNTNLLESIMSESSLVSDLTTTLSRDSSYHIITTFNPAQPYMGTMAPSTTLGGQ